MKAKLCFILASFFLTVFSLNAQESLEKGPDPQTAPHPAEQQLPIDAKATGSTKQKGQTQRSVTPFVGQIDVDLDAAIPSISVQNTNPAWASYSLYFNDMDANFLNGITGSSSGLAYGPEVAFQAFQKDMAFWSIGSSTTERMRILESTGQVGIGTSTPATNSMLHVVQSVDNPVNNGIIFGQFDGPVASDNDTPGVLGENTVDDWYGIGVIGRGGYRGVVGEVIPIGGNSYTGVRGAVTGGTGTNYGVYGYATGSGRNYAVFGSGDLKATSQLFIGTSAAQEDAASSYELVVDGQGILEEVRVKNSTNWPDFVFAENYQLRPIEEMEQFITENGHLPGVPSAGEIEEQGGSDLGLMQKVLLEKVEELSLYVIDLKKENDELRQMVEGQQKRKKNRKK